jgi:hypothetical protein
MPMRLLTAPFLSNHDGLHSQYKTQTLRGNIFMVLRLRPKSTLSPHLWTFDEAGLRFKPVSQSLLAQGAILLNIL